MPITDRWAADVVEAEVPGWLGQAKGPPTDAERDALVAEGGGKVNQKPIVDRWTTDVVEPGIPKENANSMGKWKIDRSVSRMDDSVKITASLEATNKNSIGKPVSLNFSCTKSKRDIKAFVDFGEWVAIHTNIENPVWVRIDKGSKSAYLWGSNQFFNGQLAPFHLGLTASHQSGYGGASTYLEEIEFTMRWLMDTNRLLIQITPFLKSERILEFQTSGFSEATKLLIEACDLTNMWPKIPKSAIGIVKGREMVWVVNPQTNKAELRYIYTNINQKWLFNTIESGKVSVKSSGLKFGDKIIANPSGITSGMQVNDKVSVFTFTKP
ncbi:hypothetical protein SP60_07715 [Candidatus Thioglobus autotrophicus]|jgi:hypothetical protein|uniref:Uncharacterized protein n=2 Tax=Candidatus Thioglobus autotrophicus TaxID=1705394 RepID=A0A0M5LER9_9GAMM|nr:hypothetical protein SP60_07715 [Candidatus Thioglobus autotrophicus]